MQIQGPAAIARQAFCPSRQACLPTNQMPKRDATCCTEPARSTLALYALCSDYAGSRKLTMCVIVRASMQKLCIG